MLSNKLTFSLASLIVLLMLAFIASPVMAQTTKPTATIVPLDVSDIRGEFTTADPGATPPVVGVAPKAVFRVTFSHVIDAATFTDVDVMIKSLDSMGTPSDIVISDVSEEVEAVSSHRDTTMNADGSAAVSARVFTLTVSSGTSGGNFILTNMDHGIRIEISNVEEANNPAIHSGPNKGNTSDTIIYDYFADMSPILGDTTVTVSGPALLQGASVTFTLTFTMLDAAGMAMAMDPAVTPLASHLMVEPMDATIDYIEKSLTMDNVYMVEVSVPFGTESVTLSVLPTYAVEMMNADGTYEEASHMARARAEEDDTDFGKFLVRHHGSLQTTGIVTNADNPFETLNDPNLTAVDLNDVLRLGGTVEVALNVGAAGSTTHSVVAGGEAGAAYRVVITEAMWGLDDDEPTAQWIELYINGGDLLADDEVILIFHRNQRVDRIGQVLPATDDNAGYVVTDRLSTIDRFGNVWALKGQSGYPAEGTGADRIRAQDLISMYRKINLTDTGAYKNKADAKIDEVVTNLDGLGNGSDAGAWETTATRTNMTGHYVGSPGSSHITFGGTAGTVIGFGTNPASFSATGVIINEVRNDPSDANLDWVELYHLNDAAGATPQNLENWTLSIVTRTPKTDKKETDDPTSSNFVYADDYLFSLPKFKLQPGEYLVIYNRDPGETILAGGVSVEDVLAGRQVNKGASHLYIVEEDLNLPATGKFLLLLKTRNHNDDKEKPTNIKDYAGNGFFKRVEANKFNTDVFPLVGWKVPGDVDNADFGDADTFASANQSFGRTVTLTDKGMYRPNSGANRVHKDHWQAFDFMGTGYDREVDPQTSPGTPGYENRNVNVISDDREGATGKTAYTFGGTVTISEVMYDAGPRWNLVQWIELYNSSMTETVNLDGWTMEIRNESTDVESYVDSSFEFEADTEILPNQTLLVVSGTGANDVPQERVYDLFEHHRRPLGLTARDSRLLSREGFYIRLTSKIMQDGREKDIDDLSAADIDLILMDEVGNVEVDGAARVHQWDLPPRDPAARQSLVRVYGTGANARKIDGTPDAAADGQMMESWKQSDITGAALTFYGHRDDIGTPGYRLGGPLPVQLSSFRPVRDKATGNVGIRWITQSELNNAGFNILRSEARIGPYEVVNVKGMIPGHGTTSEKHVYEWKDTTAKPNVVYYYQIEDVSLDGKRTRLATTHLRGDVSAGGKLTTRWGDLKSGR